MPSRIQKGRKMSQSSDAPKPSPSAEELTSLEDRATQIANYTKMQADGWFFQDVRDAALRHLRAAEQAAREPLEREVERLRVAGELLAQPHEDLIASLVDAELHAPGQGWGWTREDGEEFFGKEGIRECEEFYERKMREQLNLHIEGAHETAVAHDKALEAARDEGRREALEEAAKWLDTREPHLAAAIRSLEEE
jgi:hypothetical protein